MHLRQTVELYPKNRLLSDGTKAPAPPKWLLLLLIAVIAFMIVALSKMAWVFTFFLEFSRR